MTALETNNLTLPAIALGIFLVAIFVIAKNPRHRTNLSFFIFAVGAGIWVSGIALLSLTHNFFFDKIVNYGGLFFFLGFFLLSRAFPTPVPMKSHPYLVYAPVVIMALGIIPWNFINTGMTVNPDGSIMPIPGPLILPYVALIIAYVIAGFTIVIKRFRRSRGRERLQISYLFMGTGIFMVTSVVCDAILPAFHIMSFIMLGPLSALFFIALVAYAILRHELMDIRVVIQRGVIYSAILVFIIAIYVATLCILGIFLDKTSDAAFFATGIITALLGILGVPVIERFFRKKTDKIFFKDTYDYAEAVHSLSEILYTEIELASIVSRAETKLAEILRASKVSVALPQESEKTVCDRVKSEERAQRSLVLWVPITLDHEKIGSITAFEKKSGDPYRPEDKKLLETFAYQAATALSRALLYAEVKRHADELEEKVKERTEELRRAHENERQMMIDISHGLQTPLAVFKLKLEQLRSALPDDKGLESLERSLAGLSAFIYDLLKLAELERKESSVQADLDLSRLLSDIAEEIGIIAESENITIKSSIADDVNIKGDAKRIREAVMNVASNAIKYMRPSGERKMHLTLETDSSSALISIRDTGRGIPPHDLKRVFERFYRGDASSTTRGNGLGLTITKKIIEMHKGSITAESEPGKGTTIIIKLPLKS